MALHFLALEKRYGNGRGFGPVDLTVRDGEWVGVLGPNGSGKSTLLKVVAGIELPTTESSQIRRGSENLLTQPVGPKRAVLVWQDPNLFPLTARENVEFAWDHQVPDDREYAEYREIFQLDDLLLSGHSSTLSGGEAQRVSIVRALLARPRILLLDEPFGHQDVRSKKTLVGAFQEMKCWGPARPRPEFVFIVSHDEDEVLALADKVILLDESGMKVAEQELAPLLDEPDSEVVARLIGVNNVLRVSFGRDKAWIEGLLEDRDWSGPLARLQELSRGLEGASSVVLSATRVSPVRPGAAATDRVRFMFDDVQIRRRATGYELFGTFEHRPHWGITSIVSNQEFEQAMGGGELTKHFDCDLQWLIPVNDV